MAHHPAILIIDDSLSALAHMYSALRNAGYRRIESAMDWSEVRGALPRGPYDLIVIDVNLPGMLSGDILAAQLRKDQRTAAAKIFFHSGLRERDLEALARRAHADGWMVKSDGVALAARVKELVPLPPEEPDRT
ncbi:response regulator [Anaeromyxobacter paludicola]|uniref:Response regulatory domain-containing protein n=1 Tax=Anaeromyxobacter paludicola TaxID=2918171 RepID=A0ABN6N8L5_9BACT|nr:response regulator [Anaeromyxobacter paludicola]BDG08369.1 hypothetical protein AMPC_14820 [Anaeromyxobacter paludicola]